MFLNFFLSFFFQEKKEIQRGKRFFINRLYFNRTALSFFAIKKKNFVKFNKLVYFCKLQCRIVPMLFC